MDKLPGKIIGIDPGKMVGLAIFEGDGTFVLATQLTDEQFEQWSDEYEEEVSWVVIEDFVVFKKRALQQAGSRMHAPQVIGMARSFARRKKARLTKSDSSRLPTAEKVAGKKMPADHSISHQMSAYLHAYLAMHEAKIVKSVLEQERLG